MCSSDLAKSTRFRSLSIWLIWEVFWRTARAAWARWFRDVYLRSVWAKALTAATWEHTHTYHTHTHISNHSSCAISFLDHVKPDRLNLENMRCLFTCSKHSATSGRKHGFPMYYFYRAFVCVCSCTCVCVVLAYLHLGLDHSLWNGVHGSVQPALQAFGKVADGLSQGTCRENHPNRSHHEHSSLSVCERTHVMLLLVCVCTVSDWCVCVCR